MKEKNWKVIKIIDDFNIVINGGKEDSLKVGDNLEVFTEGEILKDPDTGDTLGKLDLIKAKIKVKDLFEKFSVCTNAEEGVTIMSQISTASNSHKFRPGKLNVQQSEITGYGSSATKAIKIGDLVRKSL